MIDYANLKRLILKNSYKFYYDIKVARLFLKASAIQARQFNITSAFGNNSTFVEEKLQMEMITKEGMNVLSDADLKFNGEIFSNINQIFTTTSLCDINSTANTPCIYK